MVKTAASGSDRADGFIPYSRDFRVSAKRGMKRDIDCKLAIRGFVEHNEDAVLQMVRFR